MRWIKVKDRLPKMAGDYLCYDGQKIVPCNFGEVCGCIYENGKFNYSTHDSENAFYTMENGYRVPFYATHWTKFPKPPKEEK